MKPEMKPEKAAITRMDVQIMIAVVFCYLTATILDRVGMKFSYGEMKLEVIQKMTACISCLLCVQDSPKISFNAGKNRLIVTAIGGLLGVSVAFLDGLIQNAWVMAFMVAVGVLLTLFCCKLAKVPYINARIGGVTFVLVSCTLNGKARIWYAVFRFVSTLYGACIVLLVSWIFSVISKKLDRPEK